MSVPDIRVGFQDRSVLPNKAKKGFQLKKKRIDII